MWKSNELWSDWPSDSRAKVLHKGNELSSSSDSCPTSRGFVDGPEDFDKMIKPPSPRQIHPVLEKGDLKFHNLHHLLQQNNGNGSPHPYILQQPPSGKKKSSTLPSSEDGGCGSGNGSGGGGGGVTCDKDKTGSQDGCHFIRVNSGRIELVSKDSPWKGNSSAVVGDHSPYNTAAERFLSRHLKNDVRHSWCGSAIRPQQKPGDAQQPHQSKRLSEDNNQPHLNIGGGFRGALASNNNNNRIYPQEELTSALTHPPLQQSLCPPSSHGVVDGGGSILSTDAPINHDDNPTDNPRTGGGTGLLSPLRERLAAIEELTTSLQSWQTTEKTEYEKCVNDLANQVSRAVALQQLMKGEVEKLQQRVVDLENHNKAMATMIIPTLMKLHDTTVGSINDAPQLKSIEPAPPQQAEEDHQLMSTSTMRTMTGSDCDSLQRRSRLAHHSQQAELSPQNSLSRSYVISRAEASASPSKTRTACYYEHDSPTKTFSTGTGSIKREKPQPAPSPSIMSTSTPAPSTSVRSSPVKAPRTSKMTSGIPKMNGSSNGNISGSCLSSTTSLSRSNSCNTRGNTNPKPSHSNQLLASSREIEPSSLSSQDNQGAGTSLELSISSNSEISTGQTPRTGIPRVSSPARTSRTPVQGVGTPKPARRTTATINVGPASDSRSSSPQRGSRLPVRKATVVPTTTNNRGHPAATSKSLPSHGTAFQSMSKSGPETTKHSKSTFGFGSPRKSSAIPNRAGSNVTGTRIGGGNKASPNPTNNLPDSVQTSTTKPLRLLSNPISASGVSGPKVSGSGKDEGYSTMSSEALAEQEHHLLHCQHQLNQTTILEKSPNQRVTSLGGAPSSNKVMIPPIFARAKVASLPKTNKITGIGSPTATIVPSAVDALESEGGKRSSIHKSNTFNTFREMDREARARNQSQRSYRVCDDDDVEDDECDGSRTGREILPPRTSYSSGGSTSKQCTSLPTSSSSASSSPCKTSKASTSSPSKRTSKPGRVTTTRMMDGNIVRIVRGSPYSIRFGEESGDDMEDEEDPSSSTILWEDSDDSDILFLPLEVSGSHSPTSSRSTLVPPPQSSGESRSYYSSWGRGTTTTATCSTLERGDDAEGSNTSLNNDSITNVSGGGGTYNKRAYPLKRTKGEVTVDILLGNQIQAGGGGISESSCNSTKAKMNNKISSSNKNGGGHIIEEVVLINETDLVANPDHDIHLLNNPIHANNQDDLEEKALIEKWMQMEEVRNEQVHGDGGEQWAWDWDGVERTYTRVLRNGRIRMREIPVELDEDEDDIIDVDLILEENGIGDDADDVEKVVEERNALNETSMQIDSSTWTKSKAKPKSAPSQSHNNKVGTTAAAPPSSKSNSQEASPEKMRLEKGDSSAIPSLEGECEDGPLIKPDGGNEPSRFWDGNVIASQSSSLSSPKKAHSPPINLDENGMVVTSCGVDGDCAVDGINLEENGGADADGEDDPPPVIEFTPEFYRLANYGSNLSFSDNESPNPNSATQSPKLLNRVTAGGTAGVIINNNNKSGPSSPARSPKKRRHAQRRSHSTSHPAAGVAPASPQTQPKPHPAPQIPPILGKMDDKVSQTDFSCSSLENMSSVSSDLSAECRNCLDIIKKLVVNHGDTDEGDEELDSGDFKPVDGVGRNNSGAFILENGVERKKVGGEPGMKVDAGSYATTWISVPKGLPTAEVDRILEILSSSESEGVLSPK